MTGTPAPAWANARTVTALRGAEGTPHPELLAHAAAQLTDAVSLDIEARPDLERLRTLVVPT